MEIKRVQNSMGNFFDYSLVDGDKELSIFFARNYDLYFVLGNHTLLPPDENIEMDFYINKDNYDLYLMFDKAYNRFINSKYNNSKKNDFLDYSSAHDFYQLVDDDNNINWISDDGPEEVEDRLVISKEDDCYKLKFIRNDKRMDFGFKNNHGITIRFRNSGSRYNPFNVIFMELYNNLQTINPEYHQISMEEYLNRKVLIKK